MQCLGSGHKLLAHVFWLLSHNLVRCLRPHKVSATWILTNLTTFNLSEYLSAKLQKTNFISRFIFSEQSGQVRVDLNGVLGELPLKITDRNLALLILG